LRAAYALRTSLVVPASDTFDHLSLAPSGHNAWSGGLTMAGIYPPGIL